MQKHISTSININATPARVWEIFADFEKYTDWAPFIHSITGPMAEGNRIQVRIDGMAFKPVVLDWKPGKKLRWKGKLFIPGLFDGAHSFELIDNGDGTTTFVHSEQFSGLLVALFAKKLDTDIPGKFDEFNKQLKLRAEKPLN